MAKSNAAFKQDRLPNLTMASFWVNVDTSGGPDACWIWRGGRRGYGYGRFTFNGKRMNAHRVAFTIVYGAPPAELEVLHGCDNPPCCNPRHLKAGTHQQNMAEMTERGRGRHCRFQGEKHPMHRLTEAQVLEMRALRNQGWTLKAIGAHFGLPKTTTRRSVVGETWSHLKGA